MAGEDLADAESSSAAAEIVPWQRRWPRRNAWWRNAMRTSRGARASMEKLAGLDAQAAVQASEAGTDGLRIVTRVFSGVAPEYVQAFAREVAQVDKTIALVARTECGHVFFSQHSSAGKEMNVLLADALKQLGGKGGGSAIQRGAAGTFSGCGVDCFRDGTFAVHL